MELTQTGSIEGLAADARELQDPMAQLRRTLHSEPEIGLHLPRTQERVLSWLDGLGYEITLGKGLSSVTAVLRGTGGGRGTAAPAVLLRADMDALPLQEQSGAEFTSRIDGAMHACGHDLHVSMLAGSASLLAAHRDRLAGDVVLMFQPGEEGYDGAGHMVGEGVLEAAGPLVKAAFGMHVLSAVGPERSFLARSGPVMSAADGLFVTVRGSGGHGSAPHAAADPVTVAAEMVIALQTMVTRQLDSFEPVVITTGRFQAGTQRNIIPETATFEATIRTFNPAVQAQLETAIPRLLHGIAAAHGVQAQVDYRYEYPATINHVGPTELVRDTVADLFDERRYTELANPLTASEDFSRVLNEVPGAMLFLSALEPGSGPAAYNHSPYAIFDDAVLADGAALYAALAIRALTAPAIAAHENNQGEPA